jgi:hypothetical protein
MFIVAIIECISCYLIKGFCMAKKTKRKVSSGAGPRVADTSADSVVEVAPRANGAPAPTFRRTTTSYTTEFNPDYSYVVKDLKRIGVLAGSFLIVLIALSFIIN